MIVKVRPYGRIVDYIRILKSKQPLFFVAENVSGMLASRNASAVENIMKLFKEAVKSRIIANGCEENRDSV